MQAFDPVSIFFKRMWRESICHVSNSKSVKSYVLAVSAISNVSFHNSSGSIPLVIRPSHYHHRSLLSSWRMGPLILFLQATLSLAATSACLQVLNPRCSLSLFTVLCHVSLGRPFLRLPSGAHVSAILDLCLMAFLKHGLTTSNVWFLLAHQFSLYLTFLLSPRC